MKKRTHFFLTNTSKCQESGLHWTVLYFPKKGPCELFDSLGENPETYHRRFRNVLNKNGPGYLYTSKTIQSNYSNKWFEGDKEFNFRIDFGANWCVSLYKYPLINTRRWPRPENGELIPTTTGINLTFYQWIKVRYAVLFLRSDCLTE